MRVINLELERWRAVAVLLTLTQHWGNVFAARRPWAASVDQLGCWVGVDLFFVISGFVITASLAESTAVLGPAPALRQFFIKRCFRLWPLAWSVALLLAFSSWLWPRAALLGEPAANFSALFGVFLHLANLLAYSVHAGWGWFSTMPADSYGVYWSLSLEEQFYAGYALLFFLLRGSPRACIALGLTLLLVQLPWARPFPSIGWFFRLDGLAWGCLLFWWRRPLAVYLATLPSLFGRLLAPLAVVVAVVLAPRISALPGGISLLALACAVPIALASPARGQSLSLGHVGNRVLEYCGSRSYSLYLVHMPAMRLLQCIGEPAPGNASNDFLYMMVALVTMVGAAEAGFRLIETPCRQWGRRWAAGALAQPLGALAVSSGEVGR